MNRLEALRAQWHETSEHDDAHSEVRVLIELESLDPQDPRWSQRLGEAYRRTGQLHEAVDAFTRAFQRYFERGFLPRAIAMAKLVRSFDATRGDLLETWLARAEPGVPPPFSFGRTIGKRPPPGADGEALSASNRAANAFPASPLPNEPLPLSTARRSAPPLSPPAGASATQSSPTDLPSEPLLLVVAKRSAPPPPAATEVQLSPSSTRSTPMAAATEVQLPPSSTRSEPPPPPPPPPPTEVHLPSFGGTTSSPPATEPRLVAAESGEQQFATEPRVAVAPEQHNRPLPATEPRLLVSEPPLHPSEMQTVVAKLPTQTSELVSANAGVPSSRQGTAVRPALLLPAQDSCVDEVRFVDAPNSSVDILVDDLSEDAILIDEGTPATKRPGTQDHVPLVDPPIDRYATMATVRLFACLSRDALVALSNAAELVEFPPGARIAARDQRASSLYAIVSGSARATVTGNASDLSLKEGDVFGEDMLLDEGKRQASVHAESALMALRIQKRALDEVIKEFPEVEAALFDLLARRLITNLMHTSPLFTAFSRKVRLELAQKFEVRRAPTGTIIAKKGRRSDGLYVLLAGNVIAETDRGPTRIARGAAFGHASLLGSGAADVTVRVATEAVLLRMPATGFAMLAAQYPPALAHLAETANEPLPSSERDT
ncbi:MAG TPA: cyclic nucleotide-binding domain-containing protein [Labilithrix sp.]|nr:cyclic nucleotide-binding domain-containing protein [Labilithrix sp.]